MARLQMYSTAWCGDCKILKSLLAREGVDFEEIDIEARPEAAAELRAATGKRGIPFLKWAGVFHDFSTAPDAATFHAWLREQGLA